MELITAAFVGKLAEEAAGNAVKSIGSKLRDSILGTEKEKAFEKCLRAGIWAMIAGASSESKDDLNHLSSIFSEFFGNLSVGSELAQLLRGKLLDRKKLETLFEETGFDAETLPGLDFTSALAAFEAAFITAATDEPTLQGTIQTNQLMTQTHLSQQLLEEMRGLVDFLRDARDDTLQTGGGQIIASAAADGKTVSFRLSHAGQLLPSAGWENHYLRTLISLCDPLDLSPIDETQPQGGTAGESRVRISDVFTTLYLEGLTRRQDQSVAEALARKCEPEAAPADELNSPPVQVTGDAALPPDITEAVTEPADEPKSTPVQAIEAVAALSRIVILGQPGGGKSTLVNHIATQLAKRRLGEIVAPEKLSGWPGDSRPLPVRIILRHFAAWVPVNEKSGTAGLVWNYLEHLLSQWGSKETFALLKEELTDKGGVIFFDGMDEVRETDRDAKRTLIKEAIEAFSEPLDKCTVVVTCREYAYTQSGDWHLDEKEFRLVKLALFNLEQIKDFTLTWYRIIGPQKGWDEEKSRSEAEVLNQAVNGLPHLKELAAYPLLLTLMAQVHGRDGFLPMDRADLYERAVNLLLAHWENRIVRDEQGGRQVEPGLVLRLEIRTETLRNALERVAFAAHERQEKDESRGEHTGDIPKEDLREALHAGLSSLDKADQVIAYVQERAGLLQALDNRTYSFPHRTFQEYLAARHILKQSEFDTILRDRLRRDPTWWREVFLLAAGSLRSTPRMISDLVDKLLPKGPGAGGVTEAHAEWVRVAAQALRETDFEQHVKKEQADEPGRFSETFETVQQWLLATMRADTTVSSRLRSAAGNELSRLGDPRSDVMTLDAMEFCLVPAGPFWMGNPNADDGGKAEPIHENRYLSYDYWIARFPFTYAQFGELAASRDDLREHWLRLSKSFSRFDLLNNSVTNPAMLSWQVAISYCEELTQKWTAKGVLPKGFVVSVPSEAEWEKAARGGMLIPRAPVISPVGKLRLRGEFELQDNPLPQRPFPWGQDDKIGPFVNLSNWFFNLCTPTGCFPSGASPYGCEEMVENIGCWTRSIWGDDVKTPHFGYPYKPDDGREVFSASNDVHRVIRGTSTFATLFIRRRQLLTNRGPSRQMGSGLRLAIIPEAALKSSGGGADSA